MYDRGSAADYALIDEWKRGVGWFAHPDEEGMRASHAFRFDDGVWIVDPLDAPGIEEAIEALGEIAGVVVCSCWHARDAGTFADRYDVPVHLPGWVSRVETRVDAPIARFETTLGDSGVTVIRRRPFPGAEEAFLFHEPTGTLYIPDSLGTTPHHLVGDERIGVQAFLRPVPPRGLRSIDPERICCGHGAGVFEDAAAALEDAIAASRRRFPRAFVAHFSATARAGIAALRG